MSGDHPDVKVCLLRKNLLFGDSTQLTAGKLILLSSFHQLHSFKFCRPIDLSSVQIFQGKAKFEKQDVGT